MRTLLLIAALGGCAAAEPEAPTQPPTCSGGKCDVFGEDDRRELYQVAEDSLEHRLARSSAMLAAKADLEELPGGDWRFPQLETVGDVWSLCESEPFREQPRAAKCSATLVADDLVLTSGHCVMAKEAKPTDAAVQTRCAETLIVFGFAYEREPEDPIAAVTQLPADNVYRCVEIVAAENTSEVTRTEHDYAIIRLDRPVTGREPVPVRGGPAIVPGEPVLQIGHPAGIPQKLASGVVRAKIDGRPFDGFAYEADLFGGNSGGGVFDLQRGALMGAPSHYNGQNYITAPEGGCRVAAVCGVNVTCNSLPGAYDTVTLLSRLPAAVSDRLTVVR